MADSQEQLRKVLKEERRTWTTILVVFIVYVVIKGIFT